MVNGKKLDDQWIVKKIMLSLNVKFDYATIVIKEGNDIFTLTVDGLMNLLCSHE